MMKWPLPHIGEETLRGAPTWSIVGVCGTVELLVQAVQMVQNVQTVFRSAESDDFNCLNVLSGLNLRYLLLPRFPDFEDPLLRFFVLRAHARFGVGEGVLLAGLALLIGNHFAHRHVGAQRGAV